MEKKEFAIILWLFLNLLDFYLTVYALNTGRFKEINPLMAENFLLGCIMKVAIIPMGFMLIYDRVKLKVLYFVDVAYILVVANNISQLYIMFT